MRTINAGEELTFDHQMEDSGDISSDSIDYSSAKKESELCVMWSCDLQSLRQQNFQEIELRIIVVLFISNGNILKNKCLGLFLYYQYYFNPYYPYLKFLFQTIGQNALLMFLKRGTQGHIDQFEIYLISDQISKEKLFTDQHILRNLC